MDADTKPRDYRKTTLYVRAAAGLKLRDHKVQRLVQRMRIAMPWLQASDIPQARAWAQLEVIADQVYAALRAMGPLNSNGEARRLVDDFRKLRQTQNGLANALGMTPASRLALGVMSGRSAIDIPSNLANRVIEAAAGSNGNGARGNGSTAVASDPEESLPAQPDLFAKPAEGVTDDSDSADSGEDQD